MEEKFLTLKSKVNINCTLCDKCCQNRGDIKLTPINVIEIAKFLKITPNEFIEKYTHKVSDDSIEIAINAEGDKGFCVFNTEGTYKCKIQKVKPVQCVVFPLVPVDLSRDLFINTNQCPIDTNKITTVNKWFNGNNNIYKKHKEIYIKWIDFLEEIESKWPNLPKETKETINNLAFRNYSVKDGKKQVLERLKQARMEIYKK